MFQIRYDPTARVLEVQAAEPCAGAMTLREGDRTVKTVRSAAPVLSWVFTDVDLTDTSRLEFAHRMDVGQEPVTLQFNGEHEGSYDYQAGA